MGSIAKELSNSISGLIASEAVSSDGKLTVENVVHSDVLGIITSTVIDAVLKLEEERDEEVFFIQPGEVFMHLSTRKIMILKSVDKIEEKAYFLIPTAEENVRDSSMRIQEFKDGLVNGVIVPVEDRF